MTVTGLVWNLSCLAAYLWLITRGNYISAATILLIACLTSTEVD